jgi:hypothetical protein
MLALCASPIVCIAYPHQLTMPHAMHTVLSYRTVPGLNILLYNALNGNGDELYGIEPMSYYIKNLFLTTPVAWLGTLASPLALLYSLAYGRSKGNIGIVITMHGLVYIWLSTLFFRPHKVIRSSLS